MAGASGGRQLRGRTTGTPEGRGGRGGRGKTPAGRPPPPPPPPPLLSFLEETATALANIADSPATRTRQQLMLAIQSGSNSASRGGGGRRRQREGAGGVNDDSPARRIRQRLAAASNVSRSAAGARTGTNAARMMRRLFANTADTETDSIDDDNDDDGDYEEPYEDEPVADNAPAADGQTLAPEQVQYGTNRLTNVGRDWLLEKCVKEDVFPKIKFANLDIELAFSNDPLSICRFMAGKMNVQEENVEGWWKGAKKAVHKKLKTNRNNVIKAVKSRFHGKSTG